MRFLVCEWTAYMQQDLEDCLHAYGIETIEYGYRWIGNFEEDEYFVRNFRPILEKEKSRIDAVISMNYMAPLAVLCFEFQLPYIAWVYDCPFGLLHPEKTLGLPTNHVFFFDRAEAAEFINKGFETVYHLPLAVNTGRIESIDGIDGDWIADVSFVGIMYGNQYEPLRRALPDYEGGYIDGLVRIQSMLYGTYVLKDCLNDVIDDKWQSYYSDVDEIMNMPGDIFVKWMEGVIAKEITRRERKMILSKSLINY